MPDPSSDGRQEDAEEEGGANRHGLRRSKPKTLNPEIQTKKPKTLNRKPEPKQARTNLKVVPQADEGNQRPETDLPLMDQLRKVLRLELFGAWGF